MSWTKVPITDVTRIVSGATPSTSNPDFWDGDIAWVTPKDLSDLNGHKFLQSTPRKLTAQGLQACSAEVLPTNSVLFSSRAPIGLVAINSLPVATNQGFKSFIPDHSRLDTGFLYHWLRRNRPMFERLGVGATFKEVSKTIVARVEIPLPPLEDQRRIAGILDRAEELRAKRRAAIALLDQLPQAIFLEMFGEPTANPMGWPNSHLLSDFADLVSGITKGRKLNGQAVREVPYMAVINVQDKRLSLDTVKTIEATEAEVTRYRLQMDDLLLTEGGDPDKLGRGTLWNEELPEAIHQNHVFRVRLTSQKLKPLYLSWLIGSAYGKAYFLRQAKQTTGIATINMGQLKAFPVLLPPASLQQEFADRARAAHRAKAAHQSALTELDALFGSLQDASFNIVPSPQMVGVSR